MNESYMWLVIVIIDSSKASHKSVGNNFPLPVSFISIIIIIWLLATATNILKDARGWCLENTCILLWLYWHFPYSIDAAQCLLVASTAKIDFESILHGLLIKSEIWNNQQSFTAARKGMWDIFNFLDTHNVAKSLSLSKAHFNFLVLYIKKGFIVL